jgi:hypothetical protein
MKEQREIQTHIDELNAHIKAQSDQIDLLKKLIDSTELATPSLAVDAKRYRWLRKYTGQMFMATEKQVDAEVDRVMAGGAT